MTQQANVSKIVTSPPPATAAPERNIPAATSAAARRAESRSPLAGTRNALDRVIIAGWLNLEVIAWIVLIGLAVLTRVVDLGTRAMHHDEGTHANFSYQMYKGTSFYKYDPTWHGPFLYYMVALSYFAFGGASETTARLMPAFYGIGTVLLCLALRPIIGKIGAIVMGVLMLLSPTMLYYSRTLRHDVFATFGEFLFVIATFRFMQNKPGRKIWWLGLAGLGLIIEYSSHEMVFLNTAVLVLWLGVVFFVEVIGLPNRVKNRAGLSEEQLLEDAAQEKLRRKIRRTGNINVSEAEPELVIDNTIDNISPTNNAITEKETEENDELDDFSAENNGEPAVEPNATPIAVAPRVTTLYRDPLLGNWAAMGGVFFVAFAALVLIGSIYLFQQQPIPTDSNIYLPPGVQVPATLSVTMGTYKAFGIPQWLLEIPLGLIFALVGGYLLGGLYSLSAGRLSRVNATIARVVAIVLFVFLGLVVVAAYFLGKSVDKVSTVDGFTKLPKTIYFAGLLMPSVVAQLVLILIAALFLGLLAGWLKERRMLIYTANGLYGAGIAFFGVMLIATLVSLRFALVGAGQAKPQGGLFLVGPIVDKWVAYVFNGFFLAIAIGFVAGWLVSLADHFADSELIGSGSFRGILRIFRQPWALALFFLAFGIPYILLFGDFFFNMPGLADGIYRGVEYWAEAQGIRRLDEAWFYYPFIMVLYEIIASVFFVVASIYFPVVWVRRCRAKNQVLVTVRGMFIGYTIWWTFMAQLLYSVAGEKAPWLNMQTALPASLAAAAFLNEFYRQVRWREFLRWGQGPLAALLTVLVVACIGVIVGMLLSKGSSPADRVAQIVQVAIVFVILAVLVGLFVWLYMSGRMRGHWIRTAMVSLLLLFLTGYTIKTTIALNYDHPDTASEMLIYVQTTPEVPLFLDRLQRLSRDLRDTYKTTPPPPGTVNADPANTYGLPILVDNEVATPLLWYLRDYTDVGYICVNHDPSCPNQKTLGTTADSRGNNYVVILVNSYDESPELQQQLAANYTMHTYKFRWWFPGESSGMGNQLSNPDGRENMSFAATRWDVLWRDVTQQPYLGNLWNFIMYRTLTQPLQSVNMDVYVRNDADPDFSNSDLVSPSGDGTAAATTVFNMTDAAQAGHKDGQFNQPRAIAMTPDGGFAVLDAGNGRVELFDKDGKFLKKFGSFGSGNGQFGLASSNGGPTGIAVDSQGNIYVSDTWNYRIEKFDKDGNFVKAWGQGFDTKGVAATDQQNPTGFYGPRGIFYDAKSNHIFLADTGNKRIVIFDTDGNYVSQFGTAGSGQGQFDEPVDVAVRSDGEVFVSDLNNHRVEILDQTGKYIGEIPINWQAQLLSEPYITFDSQNDMFVSDPPQAAIYKYGSNNQLLTTYNSNNGASVINPTSMVFAPDGFLYVVDPNKNAVVKVKP